MDIKYDASFAQPAFSGDALEGLTYNLAGVEGEHALSAGGGPDFTALPDPADEIRNLLDYNGFDYAECGGCFYLLLKTGLKKWQVCIRAENGGAAVYGRYPFTAPAQGCLAAINGVNSRLERGCLYMAGQRLMIRTYAELYDGYYAYEAIARALEYNAEATVRNWDELSNSI